jgi:hypothetical protein
MPIDPSAIPMLAFTYQRASNSYMTGGEPGVLYRQMRDHRDDPKGHPDPSEIPISYAEMHTLLAAALRAARACDSAISASLGGAWWQGLPRGLRPFGNSMSEAGMCLPGVTYVWNAVEHDAAEPVAFAHGEPRRSGRGIIMETVWGEVTGSRRSGERTYRERMLGRSIVMTLSALQPVFLTAVLTLVDRGVIGPPD